MFEVFLHAGHADDGAGGCVDAGRGVVRPRYATTTNERRLTGPPFPPQRPFLRARTGWYAMWRIVLLKVPVVRVLVGLPELPKKKDD